MPKLSDLELQLSTSDFKTLLENADNIDNLDNTLKTKLTNNLDSDSTTKIEDFVLNLLFTIQKF